MEPMEPDEYIEINGRRFTPDQLNDLLGACRGNIFLIREAMASVALDHDDQGGTRHVCDDRCAPECQGH